MDSVLINVKRFANSLVKLSEDENFYPSIILASFIFLVVYYFIKVRRLPPGPFGLPLIGYLPMLKSDQRAQVILKLSREHKSDIVCIRMYGKIIVFLNSYRLVKECFVKRADMADRIDGAFFQILNKGYVGIIGNSGPSWKENRRFSLYVMRDFGMGKVRAEEMIQHETEILMQEFSSFQGRTFNPQKLVNSAVSNIICSMIFGKRYEYDNEEFVSSLKSMNTLLSKFGGSRIWMLLRRKWGRVVFSGYLAEIRRHFDGFAAFARQSIREHIDNYNGSMNDLIDAYLKECYEENKSPSSSFSEENLQYLINDMFLAGSETTYTTLRWSLLYMASYPVIQDKVYKELKEILGDRLPQMSDKKSTPFTEATLSEIQRMNTLLPLGLFHTNSNQDFEIQGYHIPQGTPVAANLHAIHRDPAIWSNPDNFDPCNFLKDGKVVNLEYLIPFGIGRRSCAGEALARMELYIFFASWMMKFKVEFSENDRPSLQGVHRGVWQPEQFQIRMIPRAEFEE